MKFQPSIARRVAAAIALECEFAANLHHEIRTPLARIRSDSELMLHNRGSEADVDRRLRRLIAAVDDITDSLEGLYDIARAAAGPSAEVTLHDCVQDVFAQLAADASEAQLMLENKVRADHAVMVNRNALVMIIRNLVANAMAHAAPATLQVSSYDEGMAFIDSGAGIAPADLPHVFVRHYSAGLVDQYDRNQTLRMARHDQRLGLGLALARQLCTTHGWNITVQSPVADNKGTAFYLQF